MKTKTYLFLFFLVIILVFILGVRYGQRVEKNNKMIDYLLKITPTKPIPSPSSVKYKEATPSAIFFNIKN